jgi:hypothetical protein
VSRGGSVVVKILLCEVCLQDPPRLFSRIEADPLLVFRSTTYSALYQRLNPSPDGTPQILLILVTTIILLHQTSFVLLVARFSRSRETQGHDILVAMLQAPVDNSLTTARFLLAGELPAVVHRSKTTFLDLRWTERWLQTKTIVP